MHNENFLGDLKTDLIAFFIYDLWYKFWFSRPTSNVLSPAFNWSKWVKWVTQGQELNVSLCNWFHWIQCLRIGYNQMLFLEVIFFFFFFFLPYHLFLHHLENRTKPISTPYDGRRWWDSNLRTPACKSPALPLCYGRSFCWAHWVKWAIAWSKLRNCAWDPILLDSAPLNYVKKSGSKALLKIAPNSSFLYFPLVYSLFRFL